MPHSRGTGTTIRSNPVDKEKLRILRTRASDAALALARHRKACGPCHPELTWPRHACDDGWEMAKKAAKSANDLLVYSGEQVNGELAGQMSLW